MTDATALYPDNLPYLGVRVFKCVRPSDQQPGEPSAQPWTGWSGGRYILHMLQGSDPEPRVGLVQVHKTMLAGQTAFRSMKKLVAQAANIYGEYAVGIEV